MTDLAVLAVSFSAAALVMLLAYWRIAFAVSAENADAVSEWDRV